MSKTVTDAIKDRRSVRKYKDVEIDPEKVKKCIENASIDEKRSTNKIESEVNNKLLINEVINKSLDLLKILK